MDGAAYLNYRKTGRETSRDTAGWPRWRPVCGANIKRNRNTRHIPRRLCPVIKVILFFLSLCYLYCDLIPPQCVHSRPVIGTPSPPCHWRSRADPAELPRRSVLCRDGPPLWCWWWWLVHLEGGWVEGGAIKTWICGGNSMWRFRFLLFTADFVLLLNICQSNEKTVAAEEAWKAAGRGFKAILCR